MTAEDAVPRESAEGQQATPADTALVAKRHKAADLFSPHRYRALQEGVFERRFGARPRREPTPSTGELLAGAQDDEVDPLISSDAPAAVAARAVVAVEAPHHHFSVLDPVPQQETAELAAVTAYQAESLVADAPVAAEEYATDNPEPYVGQDEIPYGAEDPSVYGPDAENAYLADAPEAASDGLHASEPWGEQDTMVLDAVPTAGSGTDDALWLQPDADIAAPATEWAGDTFWQGEERAKPAKQGRDFKVATIAGVLMLVVVVVAAWVHEIAFAVLLGAVAIGAIIEWRRALEPHGRRVPLVPLVAATIGMGVATMAAKPEGLMVALMVGCAGVVAWRIGDERLDNTLADSLAGVLTLLWIPFLASFLLLLEIAHDGWQRVLIVVLAVVANDTGALVAGMRFGRHKLLERVSPAKTWEGAIGGVLLGMIVAGIAAHLFVGEWYVGAAVGAACAVAAVVGDLAESALKRDIRVKDMSSILPGHGGILDRIDSLLFAAPVGYVVFAIFLGTLGGGGL